MKRIHSVHIFRHLVVFILSLTFAQQSVVSQEVQTAYEEFFKAVQLDRVFEDSKTFPDCTPRFSVAEIVAKYKAQRGQPDFDLRDFVLVNYQLPISFSSGFKSDMSLSVAEHMASLWRVLSRQPQIPVQGSSLVTLPHPYIVPGGRFGEVYYWDSYFTMLGLQVSGHVDMIQHMVDNFAYLIDTLGFIPNGNRTYYLSRSQPPFFALMVDILAETQGKSAYTRYLPQLEKEYRFWMNGAEKLTGSLPAYRRVVRMPNGAILNRYWDDAATPRAESYREDFLLGQKYTGNQEDLYRNIRAACESGWDFSSRWMRDEKSLLTIHTTELAPVDLNSLMYHLECTLAKAYAEKGNKTQEKTYTQAASRRQKAVATYCWDKKGGFFMDYDFVASRTTGIYSLAGMYPFFFKMTGGNLAVVAEKLQKDFLKPGGLVTTLTQTEQQWDAPNGWAPLQWVSYKALKNSTYSSLAETIRQRWMTLNTKVYKQTGKMVEKYNVMDTDLKAGGGEYPVQDGFGWTNGVLLKMLSEQK